jgi:hypothetical protein
MQSNLYLDQIKAFVAGTLPDAERAAFSAELKRNPALQQAYLDHMLQPSPAPPPHDADDVRAFARTLRERSGPLPEPRLTGWDRLRLRFDWRLNLVLLLVPIAALLWLLAGPRQAADWPALIAGSMIEPYCPGQAGAGDRNPDAQARLEYFANFYCHPTAQSVKALETGTQEPYFPSLANYYLAHYYLRAGQYDLANRQFEQCRIGQAELATFSETQDMDQLEFNTLLAELGRTRNGAALRPRFEALAARAPEGSLVRQKTTAVLENLE